MTIGPVLVWSLSLFRSLSVPCPDPVSFPVPVPVPVLSPYIYTGSSSVLYIPYMVPVWFLSGLVPFLSWYDFRFRYRFGLVPVPEGPTSPHQNEGTGLYRFRFGQGRQGGGQGAAPSDSLSGGPFQSDLLTRRIC
jgi:hypothetical protein